VGPCFGYPAVLQHIDAIGIADAGESMRDQQHRTALEQGSDALEQLVFGPRVEGSRWLVQDHEGSMAKECAG